MDQPIQKIEDVFCLKHINNVIDIERLPDSAGIYFFMDGLNIKYIGESASLYKRVLQHKALLLYSMMSVHYLCIDVLEIVTIRKEWERDLINKFSPPLNIKDKPVPSLLTKEQIYDLMGRGYSISYEKHDTGGYVKIKLS